VKPAFHGLNRSWRAARLGGHLVEDVPDEESKHALAVNTEAAIKRLHFIVE